MGHGSGVWLNGWDSGIPTLDNMTQAAIATAEARASQPVVELAPDSSGEGLAVEKLVLGRAVPQNVDLSSWGRDGWDKAFSFRFEGAALAGWGLGS